MAVRVRTWLIACTTLVILLVPVAVARGVVAGVDRVPSVLAASVPYETPASAETVASVPTRTTGVTRQAYDLLLDNFVTPPSPSTLLTGAATELSQRVAERLPGEWPIPTIADDASRDGAWMAFESWLDRVALLVAPVMDRAAVDDLAIRALADAVSEHHTRYMDPRQNEEHQAWRRGEVRYEGIGARLRRPSTVVLEVFEGSPAERAGMRAGDRIIAVDGQSVESGTTEDAISRIRGTLGSSVEVVVERRGAPEPLRFLLERGEIKLAFVRWDVIERQDGSRFGYLKIRGFPEPSVDERVGQALAEIDRQSVDGLILDLRGNSGGRIDVGMKVVSRFVRGGVAFRQVDRSGRERRVRPTSGQYWQRSIPIVALVDGGTASMGEILGSTLQEAGAARVVGTQTAGSVAGARLYPLENGGALQITVLTIVSGRGAMLNNVGLTPDVLVDLSDDDLLGGVDAQLETAIRSLSSARHQAGVTRLPARSVLDPAA